MTSPLPHFRPNPMLEPLLRELKASPNVTDKALATLIEEHDKTAQEVKWQSPKILEIEAQTQRTNGRVTKLEQLQLLDVKAHAEELYSLFTTVKHYWKLIVCVGGAAIFLLIPFISALATRVAEKLIH